MERIADEMGFPNYEKARQKVASNGRFVELDPFGPSGSLKYKCTDVGSESMIVAWGVVALGTELSRKVETVPDLGSRWSGLKSLEGRGWKSIGTFPHGKIGCEILWRNNEVLISELVEDEPRKRRIRLEPGWRLVDGYVHPDHMRLLVVHEPTNCHRHWVVCGRHSAWQSALHKRSFIKDLAIPVGLGLLAGYFIMSFFEAASGRRDEAEDRGRRAARIERQE